MCTVTQKQVGTRLAMLRKRAGFTQEQAAEKVGVSKDTLGRLERGTQWTDFEVFNTLAHLYGVEWADLLAVFPEGKGSRQRDAIQEIVDILRTKKLSKVEHALDVLKALFKVDRG